MNPALILGAQLAQRVCLTICSEWPVDFRWKFTQDRGRLKKRCDFAKWPHLGLCLVIEIDDLRFIERDATVGCRGTALMDNFLLARYSPTIDSQRQRAFNVSRSL
jgi:hypothetical protein